MHELSVDRARGRRARVADGNERGDVGDHLAAVGCAVSPRALGEVHDRRARLHVDRTALKDGNLGMLTVGEGGRMPHDLLLALGVELALGERGALDGQVTGRGVVGLGVARQRSRLALHRQIRVAIDHLVLVGLGRRKALGVSAGSRPVLEGGAGGHLRRPIVQASTAARRTCCPIPAASGGSTSAVLVGGGGNASLAAASEALMGESITTLRSDLARARVRSVAESGLEHDAAVWPASLRDALPGHPAGDRA